jgi:hypothetical protein
MSHDHDHSGAGATLIPATLLTLAFAAVVHDIARWERVMEASHALLAEKFDIRHATPQAEPMTRIVRWRESTGHEHD